MAIQLSSEDIRSLAILSALGGAGVAGAAGVARGGGGSATQNILSGATIDRIPTSSGFISERRYKASKYPTSFTPGTYHNYAVEYYGGPANFNSVGKLYQDEIDKYGRMQTIEEHNDALLKYLRMAPKDPVSQHKALMLGEEAEKNLKQFWDESSMNVNKNRAQFRVSSSAVSGIRITPDARIEVAWGTNPNKWYTFKQFKDTHNASLAAQQLLKADSIGRAVYPVVSRGMDPKKRPNGLGDWNEAYYDKAFAKA